MSRIVTFSHVWRVSEEPCTRTRGQRAGSKKFLYFNFKKQSNDYSINIWESCQVAVGLQIGSKFISQDANTVDPRYLDFGHLE